jgi:hypothetical protein
MGDMYGAPPVTVRPQLRQLMPQLVVGALLLALAGSLQDRTLVGVALLGLGYLVVMWRLHGTHVNDHELVLLGLRNRRIPWSHIADVREQKVLGGRGLIVEETSGLRTPLSAPRDSRLLRDRDYAARRDVILAAWEEKRHVPGRPPVKGGRRGGRRGR